MDRDVALTRWEKNGRRGGVKGKCESAARRGEAECVWPEGRRVGGWGRINKKAAHVHGQVDVSRPSAGSRLEEDLRNAFIMRRRFTAQLVNIYITSNNTSSKQGGPNPDGLAH